jgi:hypothetical protein
VSSHLSIGGSSYRPNATAVAPKLVVTSFLDGTEENLEPLVARSVEDFQRSTVEADGKLAVTADLYRAGSKLEEKKSHHWTQQAVNAGFALLSGACLAIGLDAAFYGLETLRLVNDAKNGESANERESLWAHQRLEGGDWAGHKTFHLDGTQDQMNVAAKSDQVRPDAAQLKQHLIENHRQWPSSMSVIHTFGHGAGVQGVCGLSMQDFSGALVDAAQESGKKADVVLFESCLMGNLETMASIADGAKFAIASERKLDFPVPKNSVEKRLLDPEHYVQFAQQQVDADELSRQMFQAAAAQPIEQQTLARYDLGQLQSGLLPAVDRLGLALTAEIEKNPEFSKQISECLDKTPVADQDFALVDLGQFLRHLQPVSQEMPALSESLTNTLQQLTNSIPESKLTGAGAADQLEQLSIVDPRVFFKKPNGQSFDYNQALPEGWQKFSKLLQTTLTQLGPPAP